MQERKGIKRGAPPRAPLLFVSFLFCVKQKKRCRSHGVAAGTQRMDGNEKPETAYHAMCSGVEMEDKMKTSNIRKMTLAGIFAALAVVGSMFQIPVLGSKCAPMQHFINIMGAVFLGPGYALFAAFASSLIRNILGLGTLLAFPGSMCGALLAGLLYKYSKALPLAYAGEVFGTGIIGGLLAYPVAAYLLGNETAVFAFVAPFLISTCGGTILAAVLVTALKKSGVMERLLEDGGEHRAKRI